MSVDESGVICVFLILKMLCYVLGMRGSFNLVVSFVVVVFG